MKARKIAFPIISLTSPEQMQAFGVSGTPTTLVVNSSGKLTKQWVGAYAVGTDAGQDVAAYFGVTLPGLDPVAVEPAKVAEVQR